MAGFRDGDPSALPVGAVIHVVYDYSDVRFKKTASGWVRTERGVRYNPDGSYTPFDKGPKAVNEAQIRREMANGKRVEIRDAKPVMDAKKTWEITERMIQGQFTADASDLDGMPVSQLIDLGVKLGLNRKNLTGLPKQTLIRVIENERSAEFYTPASREYNKVRSQQNMDAKDEDMLKKYSKNGIRLEWAPDKKYIKVYVNGKYDGAIYNSNKTIRIGGEPVNTSEFFKDDSPIKTGGYVQRELEERQMAGWARRSGGKQPGWYVYQDGQSYAGPYYSRAEGEEGLRLANRLHPGHKYDLRVIGTKDAKDVKPTTDSGWVEGEMDGCKYQAKVFEEGSMYGIKGGSVSKLQIRKNGKSVLEYDRGSWSGDKQYRNLAYKIANKYDRNVRREPEEAKAYAKWINSGDAKDVAYWEDPKNLSPRDLLREVNEAQVKIQRIKDKGSKEYKDAKAWFDKLMAEVVKRNRAHGAAGGI